MNPSNEAGYDEISSIGELYDAVDPYRRRKDVDFYIEEAKNSAGRVLDVGCGTGRVLLPIARNSVPITGIDQSPTMLGRARARLAEEDDTIQAMVRLEQADMRSFDLGDRFALAMIPFRPFQHLLTVADQLSTLRSIHRHLEPGGHLVFDVFNTDLSRIVAGPSEESEDTSDTALSDGRHFRRTGRVTAIDAVQQISDVEMIYYVTDQRGNTERLVHSFRMRWYTHYEIEHLLERCGYGVKAVYGNFDRSELKDGSPDMIFVAERR